MYARMPPNPPLGDYITARGQGGEPPGNANSGGLEAKSALILREEMAVAGGTTGPGGIIGERTSYHGLDIYVLTERYGVYRIQVLNGAEDVSSMCLGYTRDAIRRRALELAESYRLSRGGTAPTADGPVTWTPIR